MTDMIVEFCDSRGAAISVDRQAGVVRGVKVLGLESRNGRTYLPEALAQAAKLYEDAKVNVNHPKGNPAGPRDYQDRIGAIRNVALRPGEGLFADFHFNPKHALAEQLLWDAEHSPENVGFSHNVEARVARKDGRVVVEAITRVQSVDLVADPATTRGLFEAATEEGTETEESLERSQCRGGCSTAAPTVSTKGDSPIFVETKIGTVPEPLDIEQLSQRHLELVENIRRERTAEIQRLQEEIKRLSELDETRRKRDFINRLLREFDLPDPDSRDPWAAMISGGHFLEALLAAKDEKALRTLIEQRARLVRTLQGAEKRPQSRDQHQVYGTAPLNAKSFVEAIT